LRRKTANRKLKTNIKAATCRRTPKRVRQKGCEIRSNSEFKNWSVKPREADYRLDLNLVIRICFKHSDFDIRISTAGAPQHGGTCRFDLMQPSPYFLPR
jgi:hypothetical protein